MIGIRALWNYLREAHGVLGDYLAGMITGAECDAQITQLRRKYGLKDAP